MELSIFFELDNIDYTDTVIYYTDTVIQIPVYTHTIYAVYFS